MGCLGNIIWFICGGLASGIAWCGIGLAWCATIFGIPVGLQCFKLAMLSFFPFGKDVVYTGGTASCLLNTIWLVTSGWVLALTNLILGVICSITIIGIPFGKQYFKIARLSLAPFGAVIVNT